jgi:hypothetical protein
VSTNAAEQAVIKHLMETRGLDQAAASNRLHIGIARHYFINAEPALKKLLLAYKNTMGNGYKPKART